VLGWVVVLLGLGALLLAGIRAPFVAFASLIVVVAAISEVPDEGGFGALTDLLYHQRFPVAEAAMWLLFVMLLVRIRAKGAHPGSPGLPGFFAITLSVVAIIAAVHETPTHPPVWAIRPTLLLVPSLFVAYWIGREVDSSKRYGVVVAAGLVTAPFAVINLLGAGRFAHGLHVTYFDSASAFLAGSAALFVFFGAVARKKTLLIGAGLLFVLLGLSIRRGVILAIGVAALVTGVMILRRPRIALAVAGLVAVLAVSIASVAAGKTPLGTRFTAGDAASYRVDESRAVWKNVRREWLLGIGPARQWSSSSVVHPRETPNYQYLHNNYLYAWLRFGVVGFAVFTMMVWSFALVPLHAAWRCSRLRGTLIVGALCAGFAFALLTASFLSTTRRWPIIIALLVGMALAEIRDNQDERRTSPLSWLARLARTGRHNAAAKRTATESTNRPAG
jgi:O-antigen ligase